MHSCQFTFKKEMFDLISAISDNMWSCFLVPMAIHLLPVRDKGFPSYDYEAKEVKCGRRLGC